MTYRQSIQTSDNGFTMIELMVAMGLGLVVIAMALATSVAQKRVYTQDALRTRVNSDLRGVMSIMNVNVRQAGEGLPPNFPAIEIVDGGTGSDELVLRRNLLDEVLKLCSPLLAGSGNTNVFFAISSALAGCDFTSNTTNYNAWSTYRLANGGSVDAYIYDSTTDSGEFFDFEGEGTNSTTEYYITTSGHTWGSDYTTTATAIYILEEWRFRLDNGLMQLIEAGDIASPLNVADGMTGFQVQARLQDGSILTSFDASDDWTELQAIEITLSAAETFAGKTIDRSLTSTFFPRNVLSN